MSGEDHSFEIFCNGLKRLRTLAAKRRDMEMEFVLNLLEVLFVGKVRREPERRRFNREFGQFHKKLVRYAGSNKGEE